MAKKKLSSLGGLVYSTDPDFKLSEEEQQEQQTLPPAQQELRIKQDTKNRGGKAVTLIIGFVGQIEDLEALGKKVKTFCGTGGSVKQGEIIIQGDNRDKVMQWLQKNGYNRSKKI